MSSLTNYSKALIANHLFRAATMPKLTTNYFALFTSATDDTGGGAEVSGGAYARVAVALADDEWDDPTIVAGVMANLKLLTFAAPVGANWGNITHTAMYDALTAGNMLSHEPLNSPRLINDGDPAPTFPIGDLDITIN